MVLAEVLHFTITKDMLAKQTRVVLNSTLFKPKMYRGTAAHEQSLYILPVQASTILIMDVKTELFQEVPLPSEWHDVQKKFVSARISAGKLFACPYSADFMLVMELQTRKFRRIEMPRGNNTRRAAWNGLVEFEGMLYTVPYNDKSVWVISAKTEEVEQKISLNPLVQECNLSPGASFVGGAVSKRRIVFAPWQASCILTLDVDTPGPAQIRYMHLEKTELLGLWAVESKWYFGGSRILVLDLQDQEVSLNISTLPAT